MLLDDDGAAEAMFREDPSVGAGPGGFRTPHLPLSLLSPSNFFPFRRDRSYIFPHRLY